MTYQELCFYDGETADEYLAMLDKDGPEAVIESLYRELYPHEPFDPAVDKEALEPFGAPADDHFVSVDHPGYILSWNAKLNYLGLACKN